MNYIFIVNDYGEQKGKAIADSLLNNAHWLFNHSSPNLKKIQPGGKALIYIAGKNNRFFYANIKITGAIKSANDLPSNNLNHNFYKMFPLECPITVLNIWGKPLYMVDIKDELTFITDKKNYGLFLRQSNRVLANVDYEYVVKRANEQ